jgi:hypothetical protein
MNSIPRAPRGRLLMPVIVGVITSPGPDVGFSFRGLVSKIRVRVGGPSHHGQERFLRQFLGPLHIGDPSSEEPPNGIAIAIEQCVEGGVVPAPIRQHEIVVGSHGRLYG